MFPVFVVKKCVYDYCTDCDCMVSNSREQLIVQRRTKQFQNDFRGMAGILSHPIPLKFGKLNMSFNLIVWRLRIENAFMRASAKHHQFD